MFSMAFLIGATYPRALNALPAPTPFSIVSAIRHDSRVVELGVSIVHRYGGSDRTGDGDLGSVEGQLGGLGDAVL